MGASVEMTDRLCHLQILLCSTRALSRSESRSDATRSCWLSTVASIHKNSSFQYSHHAGTARIRHHSTAEDLLRQRQLQRLHSA